MRFVALSLVSVLLASVWSGVESHSRFKCPTARDWNDATGKHIPFDNTGNKVGPCGPFSGKWGMGGNVTLTANSWQTFTWEESIAHAGAPFRVSILDENEVERVTLLDHIPHNDAASPIPYVETTYVPYSISVFIPDVLCAKCSIRLLYVMTDKTTKCDIPICTYYADDSACSGKIDSSPTCYGAPNNNPCKRSGTCYSNYHSCIDVSIYGKTPVQSARFPQPSIWPSANQTELHYGQEVGTWTNGWLQGVPSEFSTQAGTDLC